MISYQEYITTRRICFLFLSVIAVSLLSLVFIVSSFKDEFETVIIVPEPVQHVKVEQQVRQQTVSPQIEEVVDDTKYSFSDEESYLLAKIAMAEAEGEDLEGKILVIQVVLNRVEDDWRSNIKEVIYQKNQFEPISNGRFDSVEPNDECWEALRIVESGCYEPTDALYFTSESEASTWHSRNLEFLFEHGGHKFYK